MKTVQIPISLFFQLYGYVVMEDHRLHDDLVRQLEDKQQRIYNNLLYTTSKTAKTEDEREEARMKYLDEVGILDSFRY